MRPFNAIARRSCSRATRARSLLETRRLPSRISPRPRSRSAQANLDTAKINLGYTDITAPIAGRLGRTNVTKGNVVGPDSGVLVTMVSQDPMYVTFPVSQRDYLAAQKSRALRRPQIHRDAHQIRGRDEL